MARLFTILSILSLFLIGCQPPDVSSKEDPEPHSEADIMQQSAKAGFYLSNDFPDVGTQIRKAREQKGLTQLELGKATGLSDKNVNNIESGRAMPTREIIFEIQEVLDCEIILDAL